jgi:hypothetical protein
MKTVTNDDYHGQIIFDGSSGHNNNNLVFASTFNASTNWTLSGSIYYINFTHNLDLFNIIVNVWDETTTPVLVVADITNINSNTTRVSVNAVPDSRFKGRIVILGVNY